MANRHKAMCKARGGGTMAGRDDYTGSGEPNVIKEAKAKKGGGAVNKPAGGKSKSRIHKARGGSAGSDKHPFSSAYRGSSEA